MTEKGMSKGCNTTASQCKLCRGGYENLIDEKAKDKDALMLIKYLADEAQKRTKCLKILNCSNTYCQKRQTGDCRPTNGEVWKTWE